LLVLAIGMTRNLIRLVGSLLLTGVGFMLSNSPREIQSHLSEWFELFNVQVPPLLARPAADTLIQGVLVLIVLFIWRVHIARGFRWLFGSGDRPQSTSAAPVPLPASADTITAKAGTVRMDLAAALADLINAAKHYHQQYGDPYKNEEFKRLSDRAWVLNEQIVYDEETAMACRSLIKLCKHVARRTWRGENTTLNILELEKEAKFVFERLHR
jgi:hypothetical protein